MDLVLEDLSKLGTTPAATLWLCDNTTDYE